MAYDAERSNRTRARNDVTFRGFLVALALVVPVLLFFAAKATVEHHPHRDACHTSGGTLERASSEGGVVCAP